MLKPIAFFVSQLLLAHVVEAQIIAVSFDDLKERVSREIDGNFDIDRIRKSPTVQMLIKADSGALYHQLLLNEKDLILKVVGLVCIQEMNPRRVLVPAAQFILTTPAPGSPSSGFATELIRNQDEDPDQLLKVAQLLSLLPVRRDNLVVLLASLRNDNVIELFMQVELRELPVETLAFLVDGAYEAAKSERRLSDPLKHKIGAALQQLRQCPGVPRSVYLRIIDPIPGDYSLLLNSVLFDTNVDDAMLIPLLATRKGDQIQHLKSVVDRLPASRKVLVQRFIDRADKRAM